MSEPSRRPELRYPYEPAEPARQGGPAEQLRTLLDLGVVLKPGVEEHTVLEVVRSEHGEDADASSRSRPYRDLIAVLAEDQELLGDAGARPLAANLALLDTEFVEEPHAYEEPLRRLAQVTGQAHRLTEVVSAVDPDADEGTLSYRVDGRSQTWDVEVRGDWADTMVLGYVLADLLEGTGLDFATFFLEQSYGVLVVPEERREVVQSFLDTWTGDPVLVRPEETRSSPAPAPAADPGPTGSSDHAAEPEEVREVPSPRAQQAPQAPEGEKHEAGPGRNAQVRTVGRAVGVVAIVVGAIWIGQGLGFIPGSFMTGVRLWFWIGAACVLAGLALFQASRRR